MNYLDVHALQQQESERMRGSEWIKMGVDTKDGMASEFDVREDDSW